MRVDGAIILYIEIIYPLEMEMYKILIESKKYINQEYWKNLSSEIDEKIRDREFNNWTFSQRLNPRSGLGNLSREYVLSKFNSLREEVSIALEKSLLSNAKEEQVNDCPSSSDID